MKAITTTYVIIHTNEITDLMIEESINSETSMIKSLDNSLCILKFKTKFPSSMQFYPKYTHEQILIELKEPEWSVQ